MLLLLNFHLKNKEKKLFSSQIYYFFHYIFSKFHIYICILIYIDREQIEL